MARSDPIKKFLEILRLYHVSALITMRVKQLKNDVTNNNHVARLGGNLKIKWSDWPSIWVIFELHVEPVISPTPRTLRTFRRLCKSPQLLFLKKKQQKINEINESLFMFAIQVQGIFHYLLEICIDRVLWIMCRTG